jgi:gustatory receptor
MKILKKSAQIFDSLCRASSELNCIFSTPVLFLLTTKFISVVTFAFVCIFNLLHENTALEIGTYPFPFLFITEWIRILVILASADMPVNQVLRLSIYSYSPVYNIIQTL